MIFEQKKNKSTWRERGQKLFASFALFLTFISGPLPAVGATIIEIESLPLIRQDIRAFIQDGLKTAAQVGLKNASRAFLEKIAYEAAVTLTSDCEFQGPCINFKNVDVAINEAAGAASGEFLNTLAQQNGFVNLNLCDLPEHEQLQLTLLLPQITGEAPYDPSCTLSDIREEVGDYSNDLQLLAATLVDDPTSLATLSLGVMEGENALSSLLALVDEQTEASTEAEEREIIQNLKSDFTAIESPVSGYIKTPAAILEFQTEQSYAQATQAELTYTGNPFADALSVFTSTLASQLLENTSSGLLTFFTEADINDTVNAGGRSGIGSATRGNVEAARERFASLQTPSFSAGGQLDILNEFTSCPDVGVTSSNCVIGQNFRRAIEQRMTLSQAMDPINGPLISRNTPFLYTSDRTVVEDYENGLNERSLAILQSYGVTPSTWMLAARYNKEYDANAVTIGQLADAFNDASSPYFGLVDPDWVLKAPEVFCKVEGYGQSLALDQYVDTDGNPDTPQENIVSRLNSCVDEQTCLSEDNNGNCEAYGYCTAYEDRYRFSGEECPQYYASCASYENSDGDNFSVLQNTINSADCSEGNVGCQWLCGVYNDVDEAFQCASQDTVYETCTDEGGCSCEAADGTSCTIEDGGFYCTTDSNQECTTDVLTEESLSTDVAVTFDQDAVTCDDDDAGCTEFIPVSGGANIVFNNSFESFNDSRDPSEEEITNLAGATDTAADSAYDDTFGFYGVQGDGADTTLAGEPCSAASDPQSCFGWELNGASARAVSDSIDGSVAMQLQDGAGQAQMRFDTGYPLENRTFALSFSSMNPTGNTCTGQYWVAPTGDGATYAADIDFGTSAGTYATEFADTITFPDGVSETIVEVGFSAPSGCDAVFDAVILVEDEGSPGSLAYGDASSLEYVNVNTANQCSPDEIGCTEFTPESGESDFVVTGQITNPLSEACGDGTDFSDPSCSQCVEEFVGCDAHIELPTPYNSPINDVNNFSIPPSTELAAAIAQRTGLYCDGTTTACNSDADCDSGVQCLPSVSIVPDQAQSCSADAVGCEEYVNLNEVGDGGEGLEYYTFTQQCVQPTQDQIDNEEINFFYSFESTESGYQLRSHYLKVSDDGTGAPCTNLDNYDLTGTAETPQADCVDSIVGSVACDPAVDAECIEYYDADLNTYYRLQSEVIEVSAECVSARNTLDDRVYNILPSGSTQCQQSENLCREYQGSTGSSARTIIEEDFESQVWDGGTSSAESLSVDTGLSMLIDASTAAVDLSDDLEEGQNYVIQFWAKGDGGALDVHFNSGGAQVSFADETTTISDDWQVYTLGPVAITNGLQGNEELEFEYDSTELYIDNLVLSESESQYLLSDTLVTCNGYEGCEEYSDQNGEQNFLKSFTGLCEEDAVGCQALIDTHQDADNPFTTIHNGENEYSEDDVVVGTHEVVTYTVTDDSLCESTYAGCTQYGQPSFDAFENITSSAEFETTYLVNDPDTYGDTLCEEQQRWCDAWTEADGETITYAKNFGQRFCEYDSSSGEWVTSDGDTCPVQNPNDTPSQPSGSVCSGGQRTGDYCTNDSDCPAFEGDTDTHRCVSYANDAIGWAGLCGEAYNECTLYVDPDVSSDAQNSGFELDNFDNSNYTNAQEDGIPDYWEELDSGESGSSSSASNSGASYQSGDIIDMVTSRVPESNIAVWHESDFAGLSTNTSGTLQSSNGTFSDSSAGNPSSAEGTLIGTANWNGLTNDVTIRMTTDNTSDPSVSFTVPALSADVLKGRYMMFHLADDGTLYWADQDHNGVENDKSDYLTPAEAFTSEHLVSVYDGSAEPLEVNAFYDAQDLSSTLACDYVNLSGDSFAGGSSIELSAVDESCLVATENGLSVDANQTYTLRGKVKTDGSNSFAIGLLYYDATGNEINAGNNPTQYAIAAYEGEGRDEESHPSAQWIDFHGEIGPNLANDFPEGTVEVLVFLEGGSNGSVYFDEIQFGENQEYTYIQNTVDTSSCNGQIDPANGCVPFRDTTDTSLTELSASSDLTDAGVAYSVTACTFDSPLENAACRARAYAADTNRVILVDQDRECSEWLACRNQENVYDDDGILQSVVCSDLGLCTERNEETGACTQWSDDKDASDLIDEDAISTQLSGGSQLALDDIQNLSGYSTIGGSWDTGACQLSSSASAFGECVSGLEGRSCFQDSDCDPVLQGYYPYNWMPYLGIGGSLSSDPVISNGDFEAVYCDGEATQGGYSDHYEDAGVERQRDRSLSCTIDSHCRTISANTTIEAYEATDGGSDTPITDIDYEDGWCGNIDENEWSGQTNDWSTENANMTIIDYSNEERERVFDLNSGVNFEALGEGIAAGVAADRIDLDNYLFVAPQTGAAGYTVVELSPSRVSDGQEYTVQFDAAFSDAPSADDNIEVFLQHGTGDDAEIDYFVEERDGVQFTQTVDTYTFGPLTAEKSAGEENSYLYIGLGEDHAGTPFVIDDVQISATLAVNGDGSEFTGEEKLIGRECRAYPEESSLECSYTDIDSGIVHRGWNGFCTVRDPFDSSKCISWFPVDVIPGEPSFSNADLLFWTGHFPVYHCVAAKGNSKLGTCSENSRSNSAIMCLEDSDCFESGAYCIGGNVSDTTTLDNNQQVITRSENYQTTILLDGLEVDPEPHVGGRRRVSSERDGESASFVRLSDEKLDIFKNIHISEIQNLSFDMGTPEYGTSTTGVTPEVGYTFGEPITFDLEEIYLSSVDNYNMFATGSDQGTQPVRDTNPDDITSAFQKGVWCDESETGADGLCQSREDAQNNLDDLNFYYVKGITGGGTAGSLITDTGGVGNAGVPLNPFIQFAELQSNSAVWDNDGALERPILGSGAVQNAGFVEEDFNATYFPSRWQDNNVYDCMNRSSIACGANIVAFYVDFEDGYISDMYFMVWDGLHRVDVRSFRDPSVTINLREVCLAAVETVDPSANTTPWWTRAGEGSGYTVQDTGFAYESEGDASGDTSPSVFGRISMSNPLSDGLADDIEVSDTDGDGVNDVSNFSGLTVAAEASSGSSQGGYNNLPYVYADTMVPFACIGSCESLACESDRSTPYSDSCTGNAWVGVGGTCSDDGSRCIDDSQCSGDGATCTLALDGDGVGALNDNYLEQLDRAVGAGWNRLRLVFADVSPSRNFWYAGLNPDESGYQPFLRELADYSSYEEAAAEDGALFSLGNSDDESITDFCFQDSCTAFADNGQFDFDAMDECSGDSRGDTEYCGIRPSIDELTLNNSSRGDVVLDDGTITSVRFTSVTDDDQEPVETVMIDWEADPSGGFNDDGEVVPHVRETADGSMSYSHVYTCDPSQGDVLIDADEDPDHRFAHCQYRLRVQIRDNWEFCSGTEATNDTRGENCTSYDEYIGDIIVRP
jgi:hypothetical protein